MKRRSFLGSLGAAAGATALAALGQPTATPKRVGCLWPGNVPVNADNKNPFISAFLTRLREAGWIEGRNLTFVHRYAAGDPGRYEALVRELLDEKVDVLHVILSGALRAAQKVAPSTPIVFSIVSDPVSAGFVKSLARPGGNTTGASTREQELYPKRLQLLKELLPRARRVAVLVDTPLDSGMSPQGKRGLQDLAAAGNQLGISTETFQVRSVDDLPSLFARLARERFDAVLVFVYFRLLGDTQRVVVEHAQRARLPALYHGMTFVEAGGLMSFTQSTTDLGRHAANYVDKILRGARPADLPVEEPNVYELLINLKAAKAIGLAIPQSMLLRADRVIE